MIIHEELVNKKMVEYYNKIRGNGSLKEYDSLIDFLKTPNLVSFIDVTVQPLSKEEVERKRLERVYDLANTLR